MADDKSEEPTPRRLRKAREDGDSGVSAFAAQSIAFLVVVALLPGAVRALDDRGANDLRAAVARVAVHPVVLSIDPVELADEVLELAAPLLLAASLAAAVVFVVQTGGFVAGGKLAPKLDRLDLFDGFRRLASGARLFAVARALIGGAIVTWVAYRVLEVHIADLARSSGRLVVAAAVAGNLACTLARDAAFAGLVLGAIDLVIVRRGWMKRLRMSKEEVRREVKESEGDPHIKQARERAHRELLASATIDNVRTANVVVVNPTHLACALRYEDGEDAAPVIVASGEGDFAARILRAAREFGVPIVRDVPLAHALRELEVGDQIPEALYETVAEILREVWGA